MQQEDVLDLVIIGAGPHALSLVTRLLETSPSSVVSDAEHSRVSFIKSKNKSKKLPDALDADQIKVQCAKNSNRNTEQDPRA
jgi:lysine/ornithine N-monooxygenase